MTKRRLTAEEFSSSSTFSLICRLLESDGSVLQMVVRNEKDVNARCADALRRLLPFQIERLAVSEWPGTKLLTAQTASLYRFSGGKDLAVAVANEGRRLSDWIHPDLPEDLSVLAPDGSLLFLSVAHEKDAELFVTVGEH